MEKTTEIISNEQINIAFANTDFGLTPREVVAGTLLKCACGFHTGHTATQIARELGLVASTWKLTALGKRYLFAAYSNSISV